MDDYFVIGIFADDKLTRSAKIAFLKKFVHMRHLYSSTTTKATLYRKPYCGIQNTFPSLPSQSGGR